MILHFWSENITESPGWLSEDTDNTAVTLGRCVKTDSGHFCRYLLMLNLMPATGFFKNDSCYFTFLELYRCATHSLLLCVRTWLILTVYFCVCFFLQRIYWSVQLKHHAEASYHGGSEGNVVNERRGQSRDPHHQDNGYSQALVLWHRLRGEIMRATDKCYFHCHSDAHAHPPLLSPSLI